MTEGYRDNAEQLAAELDRLDLLIRRRLDAGASRSERASANRAVCVTRDEVEELLAGEQSAPIPVPIPGEAPGATADESAVDALAAEIDQRVEHALAEGVWLGLPLLGRLFGFTPTELLAVVVCLAPELRRGYDRVYAYLQDDITRKRPSVDLVLGLLWPDERRRWAGRDLLADTAPLLRTGVLRPVDDPHSPSGSSGLSRFLALDPRICRFLLGAEDMDTRLRGWARPRPLGAHDADPELVERLLRLVRHHWSGDERPTLVFQLPGRGGPGEVAAGVCAELGVPLLDLDAAELGPDGEPLLRIAFREGLLLRAAVRLAAPETLTPTGRRLLRTAVADFGWLVFLTGDPTPDDYPGAVVHTQAVPPLAADRRVAVWRGALAGRVPDPDGWAAELAGRFRLSPGQVRSAVALAERRRLMTAEPTPPAEPAGAAEPAELTLAQIADACRTESDRRLGDLAVTVSPRATWADLVLPSKRMRLLADLRDQIRHHHRVHMTWGFAARVPQGVSALFSGPPGTGKTMAAEVLAGELGLDLVKVDLAGVVSKYVGETEKNLARVFTEARSGGAILFFDEADALFGKRTEVSDAHDRYANIETSYLLQRMEEHDGPVVLATNLRQNMDEAFTRRIRFVVEFPIPEAEDRLRIWRGLFPAQAPVAETVDLAVLADRFPLSGGSIRNIVLNSAFLAAADGGVIDQRHLLHGTRREYEKIGRLWSDHAEL